MSVWIDFFKLTARCTTVGLVFMLIFVGVCRITAWLAGAEITQGGATIITWVGIVCWVIGVLVAIPDKQEKSE